MLRKVQGFIKVFFVVHVIQIRGDKHITVIVFRREPSEIYVPRHWTAESRHRGLLQRFVDHGNGRAYLSAGFHVPQ